MASPQWQPRINKSINKFGCKPKYSKLIWIYATLHSNNKQSPRSYKGVASSRRIYIDQTDHDGSTPLLIAAGQVQFNIVQTLIDAGANLNAANKYGFTPLYIAAHENNLQTLQLLINASANINIPAKNSETSLGAAASIGHHKVAQALIAADVNINTADKKA